MPSSVKNYYVCMLTSLPRQVRKLSSTEIIVQHLCNFYSNRRYLPSSGVNKYSYMCSQQLRLIMHWISLLNILSSIMFMTDIAEVASV